MNNNDDFWGKWDENFPNTNRDNPPNPNQHNAPKPSPPSFDSTPFRRPVDSQMHNGYTPPSQFGSPPQNSFNPNQNYYGNQPPAYYQNTYQPYPNKEIPGNGMGIAGMVLGICGLVFSCIWFIGLVCAVVGLVLSCVSYSKGKRVFYKSNKAISGIVMCVIALFLSVLALFFYANAFNELYHEMMREFQYNA